MGTKLSSCNAIYFNANCEGVIAQTTNLHPEKIPFLPQGVVKKLLDWRNHLITS